jgi:hypothetical protein
MNERKKKPGEIILTGEMEAPGQQIVQVPHYATEPRHWQTCDWNHVSMLGDFKDLIKIWIFIYSKWQKK